MFERFKAWIGLQERGLQIHTATDYGRDILQNSPDGWEHDQQYLWWVDGPGAGTPNGFGNPPPGAQGGPGGLSGAAALPAVLRCTAIIADTLAGLPWRVYRGMDQLPTPDWIADPQGLRPDGRRAGAPTVPDPMSHVEFWTQFVVSALWYGDGFAYFPAYSGTVPLLLLDPSKVQIQTMADGSYRYTYAGTELDSARLIRLRGEPPYANGQLGSGVLDRFGSDLQLAQAMRQYAAGIFTSGIPSGYLKVRAPMVTEDQAAALQTRWMGRHGGPRRKVAVLNDATDFVPLTISPVDSALGEAKTWSLRDIALAFGVPAYMLGVPGDSSTYANVESRMTELRTFTLLPWIRRIEAALDAQFPRGTEVKIVTDGTLRADPSTRYASYQQAIQSGWLTVDEVRALEDRPPLDVPPPVAARPNVDPTEVAVLGREAAIQLAEWRAWQAQHTPAPERN